MRQFPVFINLKGKKIILVGEGETADAKRRLYERAGALLTGDEDDRDARLAVVALESPERARIVANRLQQRGLLVNVVDQPDLCDFTTPAIVDRDPVTIAIGTGGSSAGLAKALRQRLEQQLPASLGLLAKALYAARDRIRSIWPDGADRRRAIDAALDPGGPLDPFQDSSNDNIDSWLDCPKDDQTSGLVDIELTSEDPDDLTIKQARLLGQADLILAYPEVPEKILNRARADAKRMLISDESAVVQDGLTLRLRMRNQ